MIKSVEQLNKETLNRSATLGLSDKASKYGAMLINEVANVGDQDKVREVNNIIRKNTFKQRDDDVAWGRRNPAKAFASSVLGSVLSPGASLGGKFVAKGAGLSSKALRSAAVGGITSGIYSAAQSDADNLADIAADGLNGAGVGAAIGGAFPIATAGLGKAAKASLKTLRGAAARGKKIIENTPLKPLLTRTQDQLDDGVASLSKGSGDKELLGSAIRDGLDDELTAVNRYQKGLYDKAYAGIDKKADIKTANTEAIIKELRDEVTEDGRAYLNKILKNLRVEKRVKDLPQRDFGGIKPSNPAEVTANPTALRGLQHDAIGGFNSRVATGDKANLATPSGDSILPKLQDTVKDKILHSLNANKRVMAYPNITQLQSLKSEIRIINPKEEEKIKQEKIEKTIKNFVTDQLVIDEL